MAELALRDRFNRIQRLALRGDCRKGGRVCDAVQLQFALVQAQPFHLIVDAADVTLLEASDLLAQMIGTIEHRLEVHPDVGSVAQFAILLQTNDAAQKPPPLFTLQHHQTVGLGLLQNPRPRDPAKVLSTEVPITGLQQKAFDRLDPRLNFHTRFCQPR